MIPLRDRFRLSITRAAAFAAALVLSGCGERPVAAQPTPAADAYHLPWTDYDVAKPPWIADPTEGGRRLAAWGSAVRDPNASQSDLRDRAVATARHELARMVAVKIQAVIQDYVGASDAGTTTFTSDVGRTIAVQSVRGSAQRDSWVHPKTGELFVWVVVDPGYQRQLANAVAKAAEQATGGDPALQAHLQAKTQADAGFAELDRLLGQEMRTSH